MLSRGNVRNWLHIGEPESASKRCLLFVRCLANKNMENWLWCNVQRDPFYKLEDLGILIISGEARMQSPVCPVLRLLPQAGVLGPASPS